MKLKRGFSLVELLIVIAILGVLAAVIVPSVLGLMGSDSEADTSCAALTYNIGWLSADADLFLSAEEDVSEAAFWATYAGHPERTMFFIEEECEVWLYCEKDIVAEYDCPEFPSYDSDVIEIDGRPWCWYTLKEGIEPEIGFGTNCRPGANGTIICDKAAYR